MRLDGDRIGPGGYCRNSLLYTLRLRRRASYVFGPGKYNIILTLRAESSIITTGIEFASKLGILA